MADILKFISGLSSAHLLIAGGLLFTFIGLGGRFRAEGDTHPGAKKDIIAIVGVVVVVAGILLSLFGSSNVNPIDKKDLLAQLMTFKKAGAVLPITASKNLYLTGDEMAFDIEVPQDGFLVLVYSDAKSKANFIFPNLHDPDNRVSVGKQRFPSLESGITLRADETKGETRVFAFFSPNRIDVESLLADATPENPFTVYSKAQSKGIQIVASKPKFYAGEVRIEIR